MYYYVKPIFSKSILNKIFCITIERCCFIGTLINLVSLHYKIYTMVGSPFMAVIYDGDRKGC